jgi:phytoene dehydrogenase-like protein
VARTYDAVIVGAGPNGLAAAIVVAGAGHSVVVLEANETIGGGCRTAEITLPSFIHDICAAIHPMGIASPFFKQVPLREYGVEWLQSPAALAHPFDDGRAAVLHRSLEDTSATIGPDADAWSRLMRPFLRRAEAFVDEVLRPIRIPSHPVLMAQFGLLALQSCARVVRRRFTGSKARALFAGCAAHSFLALDAPGSAAFGLVLAVAAHATDWPIVRGGSQRLTDALAEHLRALGGEIQIARPIASLRDVPSSKVVLLDVPPLALDRIAGEELPQGYRRRLRAFRHGPGAFKLDWALAGPIPWKARECSSAATVHLGGSFEEIAQSEDAVTRGRVAERPFVLVGQQSLFDDTRAPRGRHTGWAYCHVPHGSTEDMAKRIEQQVERFAPGFRDLILARHAMAPGEIEAHNRSMIGGDIGGGANDLVQVLFRPCPRWNPYSTPNPRLFLCSSSTPPGAGVHGMCGYWAAQAALPRLRRSR